MESGRIRQRRRFTRAFRHMGVAWKLSDLEFAVFVSIYQNQLTNGTDWFTISLPLSDGFKNFTCRFLADSYKASYDNVMYWNVTAVLETEDDAAPLTSEEVDGLVTLALELDGFEAANEILHVLVHETCPSLE